MLEQYGAPDEKSMRAADGATTKRYSEM